jgi:hypothetical protein
LMIIGFGSIHLDKLKMVRITIQKIGPFNTFERP